MRNNAQDLAFQFTPAIRIALSKLKEVDGTLKLILPRIRINLGVLVIYLDESARTNHLVQCVVINSNEPVQIFPKRKILNERDRNFTPGLHHAREEIRLLDPCSWIELRRETHTTFRVVNLGRNEMSSGQFDGKASCVDLIQVDPKEEKEVHEINSIVRAEREEFVDTRDPGGVLDLDKRAVGNTISLVTL